MQLEVKPATRDDVSLAWPLYHEFIRENIFPICNTAVSIAEWSEIEERRFSTRWDSGDNFLIEIDSERIGWIGLRKSNNMLIIENVFVVKEWRSRGVVERIFQEMIPVWKAEKRLVQVPVLNAPEESAGILKTLRNLGFSPSHNDGAAQTMFADWSRLGVDE